MKVKNGEVFNANEPLVILLRMAWPVKASYALAKLGSKLSDQFKIVEDVRQGLVRKHGTQNEHGEYAVQDDTPEMERFLVEYNELMDQEVELVLETVRLPSEANGETLLVEPATLMALDKFIEVE
jgi:hypothetical protein